MRELLSFVGTTSRPFLFWLDSFSTFESPRRVANFSYLGWVFLCIYIYTYIYIYNCLSKMNVLNRNWRWVQYYFTIQKMTVWHQQVSLPKGDNLLTIHIFQDYLLNLYSGVTPSTRLLIFQCFVRPDSFAQCIWWTTFSKRIVSQRPNWGWVYVGNPVDFLALFFG